ncbi:hypothetical protein [Baekduia alba]|uniref:hypothetical protein n=1 Tax=Baekduia alba TaxID=2997333 RepID=UPI0023421EBD|nr:hypothetical protein [Baekduia alba]
MPRAGLVVAVALIAAAALPGAASASAPGWSTPHTASVVPVGVYAAGPNGQGVQLFGSSGASQARIAQMRAIKADATQGGVVPVDAGGRPGFDEPAVAVNAGGRLVAAWNLDTLQAGPFGLAAALGARTALPRTATVLPTVGSADAVAAAITPDGTGIVTWVEDFATTATPSTVRAATLRAGQPPQVVTLATPAAGTVLLNLAVAVDANARPVVTWTGSTPAGTTLDVARGDGAGGFAAPVEQPLTTTQDPHVTTVVQASGALTVVWSDGGATAPAGPLTVRTADLAAGSATLGAPRTLATTAPGWLPSVAGALNGRVAVFYAVGSGGKTGVSLRITLRSTSGGWGSAHAVGPSGSRSVRNMGAGVDASGRAVILWDDGSASSTPSRILAARSSSSSDPPGTYHQLPQRSGDARCATPTLILSTSGDGLGAWQCNATSTKAGQPRLARLTKAS